jgi:predicted alpha/beta hydrolase family esterase
MKPQILFIHGGHTSRSRKDYLDYLKKRKISIDKRKYWTNEYLDKNLKEFEIIKPKMPLKENAKYDEWKIHFERYFPLLKNNIILIGTSLGGIFLAKYLSENKFPKKILSIYLVCPPFDDTCRKEDLAGGFKLKSDLSKIEKQCKNIKLLFSKDDVVVPVSHAKKYKSKLRNAKLEIYSDKNGHFIVPKFPEIIKMIKEDVKKI